ncbi:hypothetical protein EXW31_28260 (plasmid) [Bacillus mycoides]|uniref:hypothetical protein n=1 Tax=Bacillus cereus group TaxID=86661 RepID=UPI001C01CDF2|nr:MULTISPECIES: hypothetical protein [Bacillus cereus group]MDM5460025.1 hypothetical protein [Bacillus cereus]QWG48082.1 hypothetical protein EXW31_28260 [Bacillus mycoides]
MDNEIKKDRTPRLVIMLTIFGASLFVIKIIFQVWWQTFSNSAYTKTLYNTQHLLIAFFAFVTAFIILRTVHYFYCELKTLGYYKNYDEQNEAVNKADESYRAIFQTIKKSFHWSILPLGCIILFEMFNQEQSIVPILIGMIMGGTFILLGYILKKSGILERINFVKAQKYFPKIKKHSKPIAFVVYFLFLWIIISVAVSRLAVGGNKYVEINLNETKNIPITLSTQNIDKLDIQMRINNTATIDPKSFKVSKSSTEVFENRRELSKEFIDIVSFSEEVNNNNYGVRLDKTKYKNEYQMDLRDYMKEGINKVELLVTFKDDEINKYLSFATNVYVENNKIKITEKSAKVK